MQLKVRCKSCHQHMTGVFSILENLTLF